jgi:hypothetical protein
LVSLANKKIARTLDRYVFEKEEVVQEILANNPDIVLNLLELGIEGDPKALACREFPAGTGSIDVLFITSLGEIVFVETKLIKNPESTRTVVAQVIDYIKGLSSLQTDDFLDRFEQRKIGNADLNKGEKFRNQITEALQNGYFKAIILGDFINPNILGMVESIQAAPHLAFSIHLVETNAKKLGEEVLIFPKVIANTVQVERSVIRLELNVSKSDVKISSEIPSKEREGNRPKKSWDEFVESVEPKRFALKLDAFKNEWEKEFPGSINMGIVGFSAGVFLGRKRIPVQYVYPNRLAIYTKKQGDFYNLPETINERYKETLKKIPKIYDAYVIGGKTEVPFSRLTEDELDIILSAAMGIGRKLKNENG